MDIRDGMGNVEGIGEVGRFERGRVGEDEFAVVDMVGGYGDSAPIRPRRRRAREPGS